MFYVCYYVTDKLYYCCRFQNHRKAQDYVFHNLLDDHEDVHIIYISKYLPLFFHNLYLRYKVRLPYDVNSVIVI